MEIAEFFVSPTRSGRGGRRFKSCHSDQSNQQLAALGFSNNQLWRQLRGQKPLAFVLRGHSNVVWPIAPLRFSRRILWLGSKLRIALSANWAEVHASSRVAVFSWAEG